MKRHEKYTIESCIEESKKYNDLYTFCKESSSAYRFALREKLIDSFTWLKRRNKIKWTYDKCYEEALKYEYWEDFNSIGNKCLYWARKNNWTKDYIWLKHKPKENPIWTEENCLNEALKYSSYREFTRKAPGAFQMSKKRGWIKNYTWLEKYKNVDLNSKIWLVYSYEILNSFVYVGLTRDKTSRFSVHKTDKRDQLNIFCKELGIDVPDPIVICRDLNASEASELEAETIEKYKKSGFRLINKAKAGIGHSSLGGGAFIWTKESCLELAKNCNSKSEFKRKSGSAYSVARKRGWLKEYTWFIPKNMKSVIQYDKSGKLIKSFQSLREASTITGLTVANISEALTDNSRILAGGYIWRYKSDVLDENGEVLKKIEIDSGEKS